MTNSSNAERPDPILRDKVWWFCPNPPNAVWLTYSYPPGFRAWSQINMERKMIVLVPGKSYIGVNNYLQLLLPPGVDPNRDGDKT